MHLRVDRLTDYYYYYYYCYYYEGIAAMHLRVDSPTLSVEPSRRMRCHDFLDS